MRVVPANALSFVERFRGSLGWARELITECDVLIDEVADRLHAWPARHSVAKQIPGDSGQVLGIAVAAAEQIHQRFFRQRLHSVLLRIRHDRFSQPAIIDNGVGSDAHVSHRSNETGAPVSKAVAVQHQWHPGISENVIRTNQISRPCVVDIQIQNHWSPLWTPIDQFVAKTNLHLEISAADKRRLTLARSRHVEARAAHHTRESYSRSRHPPGKARWHRWRDWEQKVKQDIRQTTTPVIQQSGMSGTLMSMEPRAKTVHGDEDRVPMLCFAYVHLGANALLILAKHLPFPRQRVALQASPQPLQLRYPRQCGSGCGEACSATPQPLQLRYPRQCGAAGPQWTHPANSACTARARQRGRRSKRMTIDRLSRSTRKAAGSSGASND